MILRGVSIDQKIKTAHLEPKLKSKLMMSKLLLSFDCDRK